MGKYPLKKEMRKKKNLYLAVNINLFQERSLLLTSQQNPPREIQVFPNRRSRFRFPPDSWSFQVINFVHFLIDEEIFHHHKKGGFCVWRWYSVKAVDFGKEGIWILCYMLLRRERNGIRKHCQIENGEFSYDVSKGLFCKGKLNSITLFKVTRRTQFSGHKLINTYCWPRCASLVKQRVKESPRRCQEITWFLGRPYLSLRMSPECESHFQSDLNLDDYIWRDALRAPLRQ